jgi:hypothetical protein
VATPYLVGAAGLVPCGGDGEPACESCHVVSLANNVISWLVLILGTVAAIVIIYAGIKLVTSGGNQRAMEDAKSMMTNVIIGYVIVLAGWLIIDYVMKVLVNESSFGVWNEIECTVQSKAGWSPIEERNFQARVTASGANNTSYSSGDVTLNAAAINSAGSVKGMAEAAARAAGITDPQQIKTYVALISQESSMCTNKTGPATKYGTAYGCGQMLVSTAQGYDPSATAERLRDDDAYNLSLSAKYYADQLRRYDGNIRLTLASYNGGDKANEQSSNCPGKLAWECEVNSGYAQTRNYVSNITAVASRLQ